MDTWRWDGSIPHLISDTYLNTGLPSIDWPPFDNDFSTASLSSYGPVWTVPWSTFPAPIPLSAPGLDQPFPPGVCCPLSRLTPEHSTESRHAHVGWNQSLVGLWLAGVQMGELGFGNAKASGSQAFAPIHISLWKALYPQPWLICFYNRVFHEPDRMNSIYIHGL